MKSSWHRPTQCKKQRKTQTKDITVSFQTTRDKEEILRDSRKKRRLHTKDQKSEWDTTAQKQHWWLQESSDDLKMLEEKQLSIWNPIQCKGRIKVFSDSHDSNFVLLVFCGGYASAQSVSKPKKRNAGWGGEILGWQLCSRPRQWPVQAGAGGWREGLQGKPMELMTCLCRGRKLPLPSQILWLA